MNAPGVDKHSPSPPRPRPTSCHDSVALTHHCEILPLLHPRVPTREFQSDKSYLLAAAPQSVHPGSTLIFLRSTALAVLLVARCTGPVVGHDNAVEVGDLRSSPQLATTSSMLACNAPCLRVSWPVPPARKKPEQGLKWLYSMAALPTHQTPTMKDSGQAVLCVSGVHKHEP